MQILIAMTKLSFQKERKKIKYLISLFLCFSLFFLSQNVSAGAPNLTDAFTQDGAMGDVAAGAGYNSQVTIESLVSTIVQTVLSILGVLFLILLIYGGILWMTDQGNTTQVDKAKKLITAAIVGLIIVLLSYTISIFVFGRLSATTLTN